MNWEVVTGWQSVKPSKVRPGRGAGNEWGEGHECLDLDLRYEME